MKSTETRETLMCIGGPLSTKRLSVPAGLQWFTLEQAEVEIIDADESTDGVIPFEAVVPVGDFSTRADSNAPMGTGRAAAYVRKQFVSGEKGIAEVFTFFAAASDCEA